MRDLQLKTHTEVIRCALCGGCGLVVRDFKFKLCICPFSEPARLYGWEENMVNSEDFISA